MVAFVLYSDRKATRAAFQKNDIQGLLSGWPGLMAEYELNIQQVDGCCIVIADYVSKGLGNLSDTKEDNNLSIETFLNGVIETEKDDVMVAAVSKEHHNLEQSAKDQIV